MEPNPNTNRMPNGTNVRFPETTTKRVKKLAKRHGLKMADIIRTAVEAKLPEWERKGVTLNSVEQAA